MFFQIVPRDDQHGFRRTGIGFRIGFGFYGNGRIRDVDPVVHEIAKFGIRLSGDIALFAADP